MYGNSRQQVIPPTRSRVKAGFVVYSPESDTRELIILDEGELIAVDKSGGNRDIKFKMHPGDIVGVAALFEREPLRYTIEASEDSVITVLSEECLESELKNIPVWLLAILKNLSVRTREFKHDSRRTPVENTLKSLAEYCAHLDSNIKYPLEEFIREFNWLTRIPAATVKSDIKALLRRNFIGLAKDGEDLYVQVHNATLMQIYSDYLQAQDDGALWAPLRLNLAQKRILVHLTTLDEHVQMEAPEWIAYLNRKGLAIDVSQWITLEDLGCFATGEENKYHIDQAKVEYYLTAIRYDSNLRGAV
ncbi:cyclic nucleotide-binding domain-containing protein [Fibrobacter sp.]|uniref:Crp/Fnr family transcriptional regulator n=1 Tax=Fibrobacter sp. TaxID=35828 RepID=UPI0025BB5D79|nr:cyclic nucleotide-binding domain-containing protein [Fibrobacter sp.]MBR2059368.1 cyclic nucleotide-binding domain-containing protein [Fibrobacter sp.]MBR4008239.1 cyclic nucleotide-binding domain-containing protein [Fibrobacter sp.]